MHFWLIWVAAAVPLAALLLRLADIDRAHARIVEQCWARTDAASTINALTRANARRMMELLMTTERTRAAQIVQQVEDNKRLADAAVRTLEQLSELPEDKALLSRIKEARMQYLASLDRLALLIAEEQRVVSSAMMLDTTLPALDRLLTSLDTLLERQRSVIAAANGWRGASSAGHDASAPQRDGASGALRCAAAGSARSPAPAATAGRC